MRIFKDGYALKITAPPVLIKLRFGGTELNFKFNSKFCDAIYKI
ncbi:MAG: hypothetical protein ACFN4I_05710 [Campylobacter concisus]